jgi:hypothetical protein
MSISTDPAKLQRWHKILVDVARNAELRRQFLKEPAAVLLREGLVTPNQAVAIRTGDIEEQSYEVLVYPTSSTEGQPETLTLPGDAKIRAYFRKLPKPSGTIVAGPGCAVPGGCSTL